MKPVRTAGAKPAVAAKPSGKAPASNMSKATKKK